MATSAAAVGVGMARLSFASKITNGLVSKEIAGLYPASHETSNSWRPRSAITASTLAPRGAVLAEIVLFFGGDPFCCDQAHVLTQW